MKEPNNLSNNYFNRRCKEIFFLFKTSGVFMKLIEALVWEYEPSTTLFSITCITIYI